MKKLTIAGVVIILVAGGLILLRSTQTQRGSSVGNSLSSQITVSTQAPRKTFILEGKPFSFSVQEIRIKRGDVVRIEFSSLEGTHDWTLDEFNAKTQRVSPGQSDTIEFVADRGGTFEYYCSVGNHRAMGMVGKLIVEQ